MALPKPITRQESYLANIAGEGNLIPEKPLTREEMYLDVIANSGGGGTTVVANPTDEASADLEKLKVGNTTYAIPEGGGTTVVANPADEATAELSKLKVGEVTYSMPEGGGGDADYSTTEKVVGKWIDNKPVYQRTVFVDKTAMNNIATDDSVNTILSDILNVKNILEFHAILNQYSSNNLECIFPAEDYTENGMHIRVWFRNFDKIAIKWTGFDKQSKSFELSVTFRYTKTTD